jgi:hypothetical protein
MQKLLLSAAFDLSALSLGGASIMARIEWCQRLARHVCTQSELEGWCAEEEGLCDALLDRDRTSNYRYSSATVLERYILGLEDGRALARAAWAEWIKAHSKNIAPSH